MSGEGNAAGAAERQVETMFAEIDPYYIEAVETLNAHYSGSADFFPSNLAIVSRTAWGVADKHRRHLERALMSRARELANEGQCHAQDRRFRCGLQFHGDGTLWATIRHNGEHVTVLVAIEAESIRDGMHPELDIAKRAAQAEATLWTAELNARACQRAAQHTFNRSPLIVSDGRRRRAAGVPGAMPYAGEYAMWLRQRSDYQRMAEIQRKVLRELGVNPEFEANVTEGGVA